MKSQKKNILLVLHIAPPIHGASVMGSYIYNSELIKDSFNTQFINLGTSHTINEIGRNPLNKIGRYLNIIYNVFAHLIIVKPKLVYLTMNSKGVGFYKDAVVALIVKLFGRRLIIHFHNKGVAANQNRWFDNLLYHLVFKNTKVILLSEYLYSDIKKYVPPHNIYYCPNGIENTINDAEIINKANDPNKKVELLFLSNIIVSKGIYVLLRALAHLKEQKLNFHCSLVGSIGDVSEVQLSNAIAKHQLEDLVTFLGPKFGSEKHDLFLNADVYVHPTLSDCFPLVLLEASQYALPLVSTYEGAIPEIISEGKNGFVVPKNSPESFAEKLKELIQSPDRRIHMGQNAKRIYLEKYSLEMFERRMKTILSSIN